MLSSQSFRRPTSGELQRVSSRPSSVEVIRFSENPFQPAKITELEQQALIAETGEPVIEKPEGVYIDTGLPIPEGYDIDSIRALVQDPFHVWVYWSIRDRVFEGINRIFSPEIASTFSPVLKLTELKLGDVSLIKVGRNGNYWLSVFPDRRYRVEIGIYSEFRGYIRLLEADEVRTPRGTISMDLAPEPEYQINNREFADTLRVSGFASFAGMLGPDRILRHLPPTVADVISTAAAGFELSDEQIESLPARIRNLLQSMRSQGDDGLTSLSLLHLIPEYLREAVAEVDEPFDDALHPRHISPRFMVGSSENLPSPERRSWLPSMADRPARSTKLNTKNSARE